jgi:hypothetical protein
MDSELFHTCSCDAIAVGQFKGERLSLNDARSEEQKLLVRDAFNETIN